MPMASGKIGLVTYKPPQYSETFYEADIRTWRALGYEVLILPLRKSNKRSKKDIPLRNPPAKLSESNLISLSQLLKTFVSFFGSRNYLHQLISFIKLEKAEKTPVKKIITRIYSNQHLLKVRNMDILLFGYGDLAVTRENIGSAVKARTIVSFKGFDISIYPYQYGSNGLKRLFKKDFQFYFVSKGLHQKAKAIGFPAHKRVTYIPAYIDQSNMPFPKQSWDIHHPPEILATGRFHWKKGHIYLILALKRLHSENFPIKLTLIGDGDRYEQLFFAVKDLELSKWVTFKGALSRESVLSYMKQADLLVQPSLTEGTPNTVLEAQYLGLPCVVANWTGAEEIIRHQWNGWIAEKRNEQSLADQIKEALSQSPEQKAEIAKNGQSNIRDHFNAEKQKLAFQKLFEEQLNQ